MLETYRNFKALPLLLVMLIFTGLFISSCKEEEEETQVILHSFGPSGVNHGEQIKFIGLNLDKVTGIVLPGGIELDRSHFVTQSHGLIELVVPNEAEAGKVTLRTPQGDIVSKSMLSFNVPVVIESITPEALPGTNITIKGAMVNWIEEVIFSDDISVTEFVSKSLNELVVTVPMEAQTGFLIFKSGGTEPLSFASKEELIVTLPTVTSINPASVKHTENIVISGTNLDLITSIVFAGDKVVTEFVKQSATEIEVAVPAGALKGTITLKQASPVDVVTTNELTIILPIGTEVTPKPAVPGSDDITITGTDLDLVAELLLPGVAEAIPASAFTTHTATQIVLAFPDGAISGSISYKTIHGYSDKLGVIVTIPGAGPSPLLITLYDETLAPGGGDWSWNTVVSDPGSTDQFFTGNVSWKFQTDNGGGLSGGGLNPIDASDMGVFSFSLFGGPGTNNAVVAVILNDDWGSYNSVTLAEGKWTSYEIPISKFATVDFTSIVRFTFKVEGMAASTIYADRVGFEMGGPTALNHYIYNDALENGFSKWNGWGTSTIDIANTENVRTGTASIKATYGGDWGAGQFGGGTLSTDGATHYVFSIYGGEGTAGKNIRAIVKSAAGPAEKDIAITEGAWTEVEIPLSELGNPAAITEIAFQDTGFTGTVFIDRVGLK